MSTIMDESDIAKQLSDTTHRLQSLASHFCYYTECQLATLEHLQMVKGTPKSQLRRHEGICSDMVNIVRNYKLHESPGALRRCVRLQEKLA